VNLAPGRCGGVSKTLLEADTLLTNQLTAQKLQMEQLMASVQLIKALGGGWGISQETTAAIP